MKILQVDQPATSNQPQVGDSRIYTGGPVSPSTDGAAKTRQPPHTFYKIYSKPVPVVLVRLIAAGDETFTINESDFDAAIHELVEV